MGEYIGLYRFYTRVEVFFLRLLFFGLLAFLAQSFAKVPLAMLSGFIMWETFFLFHISRIHPKVTVRKNDGKSLLSSFTLRAQSVLVSDTVQMAKHLMRIPAVRFFLEKMGLSEKEISFVAVDKNVLIQQAFTLAWESGGRFVTTLDLFAAYLVLLEEKEKLLFAKHLKIDDFFHIIFWTRKVFPQEETYNPFRAHFWGEGIGEEWVFGWTLETKKYAVDITPGVLIDRPLLVGREKEFQEAVNGLFKSEQNSVLLIGEPGTGKTTLIKALAYESAVGDLSGSLYHRRFFELMVGSLLAGVKEQGDLDERLQSVIGEIAHAGNVILFIPDFEHVMGSSTFHLDLSGALLPYLRNGTLRIAATITPGHFAHFIDPNPDLKNLFTIIELAEPTGEQAIRMVLEKSEHIEKKNRVSFTYRSCLTALHYAKNYLPDRALPGSAVTLLMDTATAIAMAGRRNVLEEDVILLTEKKTNIPIAQPSSSEKELLLHLEDKLHERVIDQTEAITLLSQAMRRLRTGLATVQKPVSFLFLGPTGVGKTETAKALAALYYGGENRMIRLDMSEYTTGESAKRLLGSAPGEGDEKGVLIEAITKNPASLVLLDEFEKAHPTIRDLFLQVFEDGRLTDNKGKTVSFVNAIIIATSNAGSEFIREELIKGVSIDQSFRGRLVDQLEVSGTFKPELLNRFDDIVVFKPLGKTEVVAVTKLLVLAVTKKLAEQDITATFDARIIEKIAKEGFDQQFGARPLRRYIQDNLEGLLSQKMLQDEIKRGDKLLFTVDAVENISITTQSPQNQTIPYSASLR